MTVDGLILPPPVLQFILFTPFNYCGCGYSRRPMMACPAAIVSFADERLTQVEPKKRRSYDALVAEDVGVKMAKGYKLGSESVQFNSLHREDLADSSKRKKRHDALACENVDAERGEDSDCTFRRKKNREAPVDDAEEAVVKDSPLLPERKKQHGSLLNEDVRAETEKDQTHVTERKKKKKKKKHNFLASEDPSCSSEQKHDVLGEKKKSTKDSLVGEDVDAKMVQDPTCSYGKKRRRKKKRNKDVDSVIPIKTILTYVRRKKKHSTLVDKDEELVKDPTCSSKLPKQDVLLQKDAGEELLREHTCSSKKKHEKNGRLEVLCESNAQPKRSEILNGAESIGKCSSTVSGYLPQSKNVGSEEQHQFIKTYARKSWKKAPKLHKLGAGEINIRKKRGHKRRKRNAAILQLPPGHCAEEDTPLSLSKDEVFSNALPLAEAADQENERKRQREEKCMSSTMAHGSTAVQLATDVGSENCQIVRMEESVSKIVVKQDTARKSSVTECNKIGTLATEATSTPTVPDATTAVSSSGGEVHLDLRSIVVPRKKLLVLDLNGLLADINPNRAIAKRPFYRDFLDFCFQNFEIGIWSSRKRWNVDSAVRSIFGNLRHKLIFCWDLSHCTSTGFNTVECRRKPLVLKELRKLWDAESGSSLPWEKGYFSPSNTLLIDDSPYKALCNPPHTGIFPYSYDCWDDGDNSLGPGGDLRVYLEGLAAAPDVTSYVRDHQFGQPAICEGNPMWGFYLRVIDKVRQMM